MAIDTTSPAQSEAGIEKLGIERVTAADRKHVRVFDNLTMWLSANLVISTIAVGTLAVPIFKMGFWDSFLAIVLFNALGVLPVAFFATLGPKLGLRQMTITRFSFGWIGAAIMALFNVAACLGWSAVNVIVGAQLITQITHAPNWVGIVVIALITTFVSLYGYSYVHKYERYAWIPMALIFGLLAAVAGPHYHLVATPVFNLAELAAIISFGGAVYGFATGWSSYAADYNVHQPEDTPARRVFWLTFIGVTVPCILLETFGVLISIAFTGDSTGAILAHVAAPLGAFGPVLLGLLALSIVANNIPNDYSLGLSMQVPGRGFQKVNRAVWTVIGAVIYVAIAIPAAAHFYETMENFLLLIAYWLGPWSVILILEHFVFRKGVYNAEDWNTQGKLPIGWAAIAAMVAGLAGVYLGANQQAFTGPIAKALNMDVGFELGMVLAAIVYLILRPIERKSDPE
ncbi:MAG: cytosine permease [Capsulimonadaceae bacterium]|nr:cytosine permease [Capsulimonadaceae bacterium]